MTVRLEIDGDRWRTHLRRVALTNPGLVPVAKGNGYGFGLASLARRAEWLGVDTIAVGTYTEIPEVIDRFSGDVLVLTPWTPGQSIPEDSKVARRLIHTIAHPGDAQMLRDIHPRIRYVLEMATSMRRHGMSADELRSEHHLQDGVTLHLPLVGDNLAEARELLAHHRGTAYVSHLSGPDVLELSRDDLTIRPRIGTKLWLGDLAAFKVSATVLEVHEVRRGDEFGYRRRHAPRPGRLLVVSGGTAHGIGLEAPAGDTSFMTRAKTAAKGTLEATGWHRSPFVWDGEPLRFAEPPHMQASLLWLPMGARVPNRGDRLDLRIRYTTTTFDETVIV